MRARLPWCQRECQRSASRGSREPPPRTLATKISSPWRASAPGNQSVGTKPSTLERARASPSRMHASALLPPFAAYKCVSSEDSASALTTHPNASAESRRTSISSMTVNFSVSIANTASEFAAAT
jgi:hypothetical protein